MVPIEQVNVSDIFTFILYFRFRLNKKFIKIINVLNKLTQAFNLNIQFFNIVT